MYSLFTNTVATHDTIIKFANDTTVEGLITNGDKTACRSDNW
jgi:hypothetical protein